MRLWHKDLVPFLPRDQLLGQWREICLIARNVAKTGTPNHILVNRMMDYPINHFYNYSLIVVEEFDFRGYRINEQIWNEFIHHLSLIDPKNFDKPCTDEDIFYNWHNDKYLIQCITNLEEKYDCGAVPEKEFNIILEAFDYLLY